MKGAALRAIHEIPQPRAPRLGPGVVTEVSTGAVTVALDDGRAVRAAFALALPYAASVGDVLLVIGQDDAHYVIGVISGRGKTSLEIQGDVSLRAVGGALDLAGDEGVRVRGPSVEVHTGTLRTVAQAVVETCATLFTRVSEALRVHAGQSITQVDEGAYTQAKTAAIQTEETVTINGKEIHLA